MTTANPQLRHPDGSPQPTVDGRERREHKRINLEAEINFLGHDNFYTGFSEDISNGGLFVATYQLKPTGTEVTIRFSLPDGTEIEANAVVRWLREPREMDGDVPPGMGLQFVDLHPDARHLIDEFIRQRDPLFFDDE